VVWFKLVNVDNKMQYYYEGNIVFWTSLAFFELSDMFFFAFGEPENHVSHRYIIDFAMLLGP
jgi:hypothetical protein